jgi:signal transduction histidine kinase/ActR/RegA family two-component response regulator
VFWSRRSGLGKHFFWSLPRSCDIIIQFPEVTYGDFLAVCFSGAKQETFLMPSKPTYAQLEERIKALEQEALEREGAEEALWESTRQLQVAYDQAIIYAQDLNEQIAERKRTQEALEAERKRLYALLDGLPAYVYLRAADYSIRFANRWFRERFGDPDGRCCYEVIRERDRPCALCRPLAVFQTGQPVEWEWTQRDGRTYQIYDYPFNDLDGTPLVLELGIDNTERKRAQEERKKLETQLHQAQKMEAIGTLAGGIAHDFNNLLMGIQGRVSLMLMGMGSDHPYYGHVSGIEEAVKRGADLAKQLLGFARGGKYELKPTDLNDLIGKSSEMIGRAKKEIRIHRKFQPDISTVEVDRGQIEQVLLNLYVNAWQAMPEGGDLYLETKNVSLDRNYIQTHNAEPGSYVKVSVTDTGVGMDETTRQRVFEPFFTTKEIGGGTGLGLASAYGIIKNHGGIIDVYSEPGQGATFNIYLPASHKEVSAEKESTRKLLEGHETVLLVDDEQMIMDVGREMLTALGYKVILASNGKQAIELYKENQGRIDMVILDLIMPEMGGAAVYENLKAINPRVKVLLSSGYSADTQANQVLKKGCDGFIQKPFDVRELSAKIRDVLEKK